MERLTAEDRLMPWPDENWPQDIGGLAVLDGAGLLDQDGRFLADAVRQAVAARLHLVPRFRQVLRVPPRGFGGPLWVDAPSFDIADHVRVIFRAGTGRRSRHTARHRAAAPPAAGPVRAAMGDVVPDRAA